MNAYARGLSPRVRGSPVAPEICEAPVQVYPRVCGGAQVARAEQGFCSGLSPRVRGSPRRLHSTYTIKGSIPACAGSPAIVCRRVWCARSIPACAGEPNSLYPSVMMDTVYPRVCGGAATISVAGGIAPGLSPRVRGSRTPVSSGGYYERSIPACAGEPLAGFVVRSLLKVYPRVCGGARGVVGK